MPASSDKLNRALLTEYAKKFFGYGNPSGKIWFIGMEEGGGRTNEVVRHRLQKWVDVCKKRPVVDGCRFHKALIDRYGNSMKDLFDPDEGCSLSHQPTWDRLIRLQLALNSCGEISAESVYKFRRKFWARSDSENCVIELLALPSPNIQTWEYKRWVGGDEFKSRDAYRQAFLPGRIESLQLLIKKHRPKVVIFYGLSYLKRWSDVTQEVAEFRWRTVPVDQSAGARIYRVGDIVYAAIQHPTARGSCNADFERIGCALREYLS